jgi:hypothetical protein
VLRVRPVVYYNDGMSDPTAGEHQQNAIAYGRVMVKIVEGADYQYPDSRRAERLVLKIARWLYKKRLRELIGLVPTDIGAEILVASDNIAGPVVDVNLN